MSEGNKITEEKRRFIRLSTLTDVTYHRQGAVTKENLTFSRNLSNGGICIIAYEELKIGEILNLKIYLPDKKTPIETIGKVSWIKEFVIGDASIGKRYDVGVEFFEITDKDKEMITKYIFTHIV